MASKQEELEPGDVVTLKSGGIPMTVQWSESGLALCQYYNSATKSYEEKEFATVVLKKLEPGEY